MSSMYTPEHTSPNMGILFFSFYTKSVLKSVRPVQKQRLRKRHLIWFGTLLNGISTPVGYLMPKIASNTWCIQ